MYDGVIVLKRKFVVLKVPRKNSRQAIISPNCFLSISIVKCADCTTKYIIIIITTIIIAFCE